MTKALKAEALVDKKGESVVVIPVKKRIKNLRIQPIDAFSCEIKWENGGQVPNCLHGVHSYSGAARLIKSFESDPKLKGTRYA